VILNEDSPGYSYYKPMLLFFSIVILIGYIIIIGGFSSALSVNLNENTSLDKSDRQYWIHYYMFYLFGLIPPIYGIICAARGRPLGELYIAFCLLAAMNLGAIYFDSGIMVNKCNRTNDFPDQLYKLCHSYKSVISGCFFFTVGLIGSLFAKRRVNYPEQYSAIHFAAILISSIFSLIGTIIICVGFFALFVGAFESIQAPSWVYGYYTQFFIFIFFGMISPLFGIICGAKKIPLGELYSFFIIFGVLFCGAVLFLSGYNVNSCNNSNGYSVYEHYDPIFASSTNRFDSEFKGELEKICLSFTISFSGSLIYILGTLVSLISKRVTG